MVWRKMLVITGTRHSGTLFLSSTLQTAGMTALSRKRVLAGGRSPPGGMVAMPIHQLEEVGEQCDRVVALIRPWRAWASLMEEEEPKPELPHEVRWWFANYQLCCTLLRAKSRFLLLSHDKLLSRPEPSIRRVLRFLEREDAMEAVLLLPAIAPSAPAYVCKGLLRNEQEVLDAFWQVVHNDRPMTRGFFKRMNVLQGTLQSRYPQAGATDPMQESELLGRVLA
ncbi:MAG: hypothetical protein ACI9VR_001696 [Cognaticolwellia sp.]|jgi:hypothetical protein